MFRESFGRKSAQMVMSASCTADCVSVIIDGQCVHVFKEEKVVHQALCARV